MSCNIPGAIAILISILGAGIADVSALPLTPFRDEAQAQRHCPVDKVVTTPRDRSATARVLMAVLSV